jgi:hypothetical protein
VAEVLVVINRYRECMGEGGRKPITYAADIRVLCESLSTAVGKPAGKEYLRQQVNQRGCGDPAQWLCSQALALVRQSHPDRSSTISSNGLPIQDLCALACTLPGLGAAMGSQATVIPLAEAISQHAAARSPHVDAPPVVHAWKDLLYGLTKAGLVVNMEDNASQEAVKQHSPHLQQLLDQGAQHLPALLTTQGAAAQSVSLTLLAYAYAGYTGDMRPIVQALASNPKGCLKEVKPQECSNILWALGKLCELRQQEGLQVEMQLAAYRQHLFSYCLRELHRQLGDASPQAISNAVYGCALAGHVEGVPRLLDLVCQQPQVMAKPQDWSNTIWAAAKLGYVEQGSVLLERLAGQPHVMTQAGPQAWANTLWAAASMYESAAGQDQQGVLARRLQHSGQLLMGALLKHFQVFDKAKSQEWSNTLWAAAKLGCVEQGSVLLTKLAGNSQIMLKATPQAWSNTLWAAAVLRWYDQHLFSQGAAALAAMPPAHLKPQDISNALYACAVCAHWDDSVQQLIGQAEEYDLTAFNRQNLTNTLYAWAVLSCVRTTSGASQQDQGGWISAAEPLFKDAAKRDLGSFVKEDLGQLHAAQICAEHLGIPGLAAGAVLAAARAAGWSFGKATISSRQREVGSVLQQLGYTIQLEMMSPDGLMSADVGVTALPDGTPCSIAVEFDGPCHFVTDSNSTIFTNNRAAATDRLDGPTRLRNALLQARFSDGVVCIPWKEWVAATKAGRQEYSKAALAAVLETKVGVVKYP